MENVPLIFSLLLLLISSPPVPHGPLKMDGYWAMQLVHSFSENFHLLGITRVEDTSLSLARLAGLPFNLSVFHINLPEGSESWKYGIGKNMMTTKYILVGQ